MKAAQQVAVVACHQLMRSSQSSVVKYQREYRRSQNGKLMLTGLRLVAIVSAIAIALYLSPANHRFYDAQGRPLLQRPGTMHSFLSAARVGTHYFASIDGYNGSYEVLNTTDPPPFVGQRVRVWYQIGKSGNLYIDHVEALPRHVSRPPRASAESR